MTDHPSREGHVAWAEVSVDEIKLQAKSAIAIGPFGSRMTSSSYVDEGVPVIRGQNISTDRAFHGDFVFVTEEKADELRTSNVFSDDLVFPHRGAIGTVGIVPQVGPDRWMLSTSLMKLTVDPKLADPLFVFYFFRSRIGRQELLKRSSNVGTPGIAQPLASLRSISLCLPSLRTQRSIASVLQALDDLIENNRRRVEVLEEMARAIYREWFVHFRFPGHEDATFVDSDLGPIPEGWDAVTLRELVSTQYGYTESASTDSVGPRYLRGMDINKTSFVNWSSVPYCPIDEKSFEKFRVDVGDVFVIRMADPGKVGMCEVPVDAVFASYLVRLRPVDERITPYYLFFTLRDDAYQGWVTGASTGSTRKSVSAKVMTEPAIAVPPKTLLGQFDERVTPIRSLMMRLVEAGSRLAEIRDLLLPKLVTGQIDVSDLDLDAVMDEAGV